MCWGCITSSPIEHAWFRAQSRRGLVLTASFVSVRAEDLEAFGREIFARAGLSEEHAQIQTDILVWANLRGVDSHGVLRIPRYLDWLREGRMNAAPNIRITRETHASVLIDGDRAPGALSMGFAMERAIEKAREAGIGWALVGHTTHSGPVGYYTQLAVREDMAGIAIVTSRPNMAYVGSKAAGVATSPIAIAVPGGPGGSVMLDMATSELALGKIKDSLARGVDLPEGGALTKDGRPTTDPAQAAIPMPLGGAKGSGLSLMFEALISLMVGHPLLEPALAGGDRGHSQNGLAVAVNIAAFTGTADYKAHMSALGRALKELPPLEDGGEILLPGEPENRRLEERQREGIPIPNSIWSQLSEAAATLDVPMPAVS